MANTIQDSQSGTTGITITLAGLASSTANVGQQSDYIDNTSNLYLGAEIFISVTSGGSTTANSVASVYLIRSSGTAAGNVRDDNAGTGNAAITIVNATPLGNILFSGTAANTQYSKVFNTSSIGELGPYWNLSVVNSSGTALHATAGSHSAYFIGIKKSIV